jgi:hypothetical protein
LLFKSQKTDFSGLKGLSHEIFSPVFWPVWIHLGLNVNRLWFYNFFEAPSILCFIPNLLGDSSPRRIDNCLIETLMLLNNILGEPLNWLSIILGDSTNLREVLTTNSVFLGEPLTQNKENLENRLLSCQSFSEILRISENDWYKRINT